MTIFQKDKHSVVYGRKTIHFRLRFCERKTLEIAVHPDRSVVVKAPLQSDMEVIERKVKKRARWILRQLHYFKQFQPRTPERCYVSGETHLYLGKQYRLKIGSGSANTIKLSRGFFQITCCNQSSPAKAKRLLDQWYAIQAKRHFAARLDHCWQKFSGFTGSKPKLAVKRMKKRWGSLSEKGTMTLNTHLIRAPKECIDYVVIHELCHLQYANHGPAFYQLLDEVFPNWEKVKQKLERCLT